jgi:hypothetical protein
VKAEESSSSGCSHNTECTGRRIARKYTGGAETNERRQGGRESVGGGGRRCRSGERTGGGLCGVCVCEDFDRGGGFEATKISLRAQPMTTHKAKIDPRLTTTNLPRQETNRPLSCPIQLFDLRGGRRRLVTYGGVASDQREGQSSISLPS